MLQVLFDANIYGKIATDEQRDVVVAKVLSSRLRVLNFDLIRQELRNTAKHKAFGGTKRLRAALLSHYDQIVSRAEVRVSREIVSLATAYFDEYKRCSGSVGKKRIMNDLKIIACASQKKCELVFSEDHHLLRGSKALKAVGIVNAQRGLRSPSFLDYAGLKRVIGL